MYAIRSYYGPAQVGYARGAARAALEADRALDGLEVAKTPELIIFV